MRLLVKNTLHKQMVIVLINLEVVVDTW